MCELKSGGHDLQSVWYRVPQAASLPCGEMRRVIVNGRPICVAHTESGGFFAIDDTCSHGRASLSKGWLDGHWVECPKHIGVFDLRTGEAVTEPATIPVAAYEVRVDGEDLEIKSEPRLP
jgi:3-phenylpropionate/trans-cinnamate dioxygenase ferredoxin component